MDIALDVIQIVLSLITIGCIVRLIKMDKDDEEK